MKTQRLNDNNCAYLARNLDLLRRLHERICVTLRSANISFNPQVRYYYKYLIYIN